MKLDPIQRQQVVGESLTKKKEELTNKEITETESREQNRYQVAAGNRRVQWGVNEKEMVKYWECDFWNNGPGLIN